MNLVRAGDMVLSRVAEALQPIAVSPAGGLVLGLLRDAGEPCAPGYISERLIVTRATVTGILDTLAGKGLIRRTTNPADRRMVLVHLTPAGVRAADRVRRVVHRAEADWMGPLSERERADLLALLGKVQRSLA
jgi:DNA-binding MarR family transcriptional regulator